MAMPRRPGLPPPTALPGRRRRAAASLLGLAVLAAHLAGLGLLSETRPEPAFRAPTLWLSLRAQPAATARLGVPAPAPSPAARVAPHTPPLTPSLIPPLTPPLTPPPALFTPPARSAPAPLARLARLARHGRPEPPQPLARGPQRVQPPGPLPLVPLSATTQPEPPAPAHAEPAPPWPVYAARLPPATTRHYRLQRGDRNSPARLHWRHGSQGYSLSLMAEGGDLDGLGAASRGQVGPGGLVPERHVERRRGRDQRATNFDLDRGELRGSGGGEPQAWPVGGQDRLSWLLQLAAVLEADAALARPGTQVVLPVAGARGPVAAWVFTVRGPESVRLADGRSAGALALQREAQFPYDLQVDVWLDPADHHLPLRLRLSAPPGAWESVWLLQEPP